MARQRYCEHCKKETMQDWVAKEFVCRVCHYLVMYRKGQKWMYMGKWVRGEK